MDPLIAHWIEAKGNLARLAKELGIAHQSIYSWSRIPAERVIDVERITGIPRHELRPDIYPPTDAQPEKAVA
jgi:DNA-binding transcriptional regulator YdaS (Cro superfamily)